ncbi:hypothetical protein ACHAWF_003064 [Thalassiosira exigua]
MNLAFLSLVAVVGAASAFAPTSSRITTRDAICQPSSTLTVLSSQSQPDGDKEDGVKSPLLASDVRRAFLASSLAAVTYNAFTLGSSALGPLPKGYERVSPLQFIAALGDPNSSSGTGAESWGLWPTDPGPRGLRLFTYERMVDDPSAPRPAWLDEKDFFLDENAIIMPQPEYPLPPGKYLVTGARELTTGLTIDSNGSWNLDEGKLIDVTHMPCRAGRYRRSDGGDGSPLKVRRADFPVAPGGIMPNVPGTDKQDYSVLFIIGKQA